MIDRPTPYPELNEILFQLVTNVQAILDNHFTGAYLQGSFALGDFDQFSDVDFLVVVEQEVSEGQLSALQAMHSIIYDSEPYWAKHLEGSYFPKELLRRGNHPAEQLLFLNNTSKSLIRSHHDDTLVVRWVTREHGITLFGPAPPTLIDPVLASALRQEVLVTMNEWAEEIFADSYQLNRWWAQPFAVLSYCRMLHTLQTGRVASKRATMQWATDALDAAWADLIQSAWDERIQLKLKEGRAADPIALRRTIEFIRYALDYSRNSSTESA
jgi:hypothetical protein